MKEMNKLILFFATLLMLVAATSCNKDEECNCGIIANDGIDGNCYWLEIRNDCSGNIKRFCFDEDTWLNNYVGSPFCVTNQREW
jgi:hypothetical protein